MSAMDNHPEPRSFDFSHQRPRGTDQPIVTGASPTLCALDTEAA
jgi:hypothetical protein